MSPIAKRVLITGGAGFIGSHLCERLLPAGEVVVYDNFTRNALQYSKAEQMPGLRVIRGNVQDASALSDAAKDCDIVIHCAAIAGIYSVGRSPYETIRTNLFGTMNALEAAQKAGAKHFVDFSTSEVYGPFVYRGKETGLTSAGPASEKRWSYAVSKLAGEHIAHAFSLETGLPVTTVRPFNVYGPRQVGEGAIRQMTLRAVKNEPITLHGDGTQIRAWCFVEDFVDCILSILGSPASFGKTFNIGNPQGTITNLQLAEMILRLAESQSSLIFAPHPGPDVEVRVPNIDQAICTLGYRPRVSLESGLTSAINWYRSHRLAE